MLYSRDEVGWDDAFYNARRIIMHNNDIVEKLTNIHGDPSHYAGFYLSCNKSGSLRRHGNSHSEQNHSSIVAYMG